MMISRIMPAAAPHPAASSASSLPQFPRTRSSVWRLESERVGDLAFPAVAIREQFFLVVEQLPAGLGGEFEVRPLDDRIDRAGLLTIAAIDAFGHVDVVARRAAAAVVARLGLDRDRQRRADRLA